MIYSSLATVVHAVFRLLFTLEYYGAEHVPERGAVIIAGNHPSYLDPVLVSLALPRRVYFMAWDQLFKVPVLGQLLRTFGAFPVRLGTKDPNAFAAARDVLLDGRALGIFPEAGRSKEGPMNPLKTGTARLAIETGAPIVPVTIAGAFDAWPSSRRLPWPRKISVKYHTPIVLDPEEARARRDDKAYHEEITDLVRERIERRLIPSLTAEARKRRFFEGPASAVRIYELYPVLAAVTGVALGGPKLILFGLAAAHALYVAADIWWIKQGRLAKAIRELATPAFAFLFGPPLARTVGIDVPEWGTLGALAAGVTLSFNWTNRYVTERYVRGALISYFVAFALATHFKNPTGPHLAFAAFTLVYALFWRPLYWYVTAAVMIAYIGALVWLLGADMASSSAVFCALGPVAAIYVRLVKFSAHDGRMV